MKQSLASKTIRLLALVYVPLLIAVVVAALVSPGYMAAKMREIVEFLSNQLFGP